MSPPSPAGPPPPGRSRTRAALLAALACTALAAHRAAAGARAIAPGEPPPLLSQTGLFAGADHRTLGPGVRSYTPQYPLWSDGAEKRRWIRLPPGAAIDGGRPGAWRFPVGTQLWKEFRVGAAVETRYLVLTAGGRWRFAAYVWRADGRDAERAPDAGIAVTTAAGTPYAVPSVADCRACHEGRAAPVLGFDALQLSPDRDPLAPHGTPPQPGDLDLPTLVQAGLLRGFPRELLATPPRVPGRTPRERAALGYLHGNCAGCHAAATPGLGAGLVLEHDLAARRAGDEPALRTAVGVASRWRGAGPPIAARVAAGEPGASALLRRMAAHDAVARMPPIGTRVVDEDAVRLVEGWIAEDLPGQPDGTEP